MILNRMKQQLKYNNTNADDPVHTHLSEKSILQKSQIYLSSQAKRYFILKGTHFFTKADGEVTKTTKTNLKKNIQLSTILTMVYSTKRN